MERKNNKSNRIGSTPKSNVFSGKFTRAFIKQYLRKVFSLIELNGEFRIPKETYSSIKEYLHNSQIVISGVKKMSVVKYTRLHFEESETEDLVSIKGKFKKKFYDVII